MANESNCEQLSALPVIGDAGQQDFIVRVPGSLYQPMLIRPPEESAVRVTPGELNTDEARFVRDLIKFLYPGETPPEPGQPLIWRGLEVWIKRNLEKREDSFRLSVDTSDWFYPDFLIWIIDRKNRVQTLGFVDPKGLREGVDGGWWDYKVVSTLFMAHAVEREVTQDGKLEIEGEPWQFRIRGALLSTADFETIVGNGKFKISDGRGGKTSPNQGDFLLRRIVFQPRTATNTEYIGQLLDLLINDSALDKSLARCADLLGAPDSFQAQDDSDHALLTRRLASPPVKAVCDFVGDVISEKSPPI